MKGKWKSVLSLCIGLFLVCFSSVAMADLPPDYYMNKYIPKLQGTWYDTRGNPVFTFAGRTLNGCPIVGIYNPAGGGGDIGFTLRIVEKTGYRDLRLSFENLVTDPHAYHQMMYTNDRAYRRTPRLQYYESVGGLALGMTEQEVEQKYGKPDTILATPRSAITKWVYPNLGLELEFRRGKILEAIKIYSTGDRRFDRTGFNCSNSLSEYKNQYGFKRQLTGTKRDLQGAYGIGYDEYLWFSDYPNSITLSVFWN